MFDTARYAWRVPNHCLGNKFPRFASVLLERKSSLSINHVTDVKMWMITKVRHVLSSLIIHCNNFSTNAFLIFPKSLLADTREVVSDKMKDFYVPSLS